MYWRLVSLFRYVRSLSDFLEDFAKTCIVSIGLTIHLGCFKYHQGVGRATLVVKVAAVTDQLYLVVIIIIMSLIGDECSAVVRVNGTGF